MLIHVGGSFLSYAIVLMTTACKQQTNTIVVALLGVRNKVLRGHIAALSEARREAQVDIEYEEGTKWVPLDKLTIL